MYWLVFIFILSFIIFYFFVKRFISKIEFYQFLVILQGFLGGLSVASLLHLIYNLVDFNPVSFYFLILWVFLEELVKFLVIYFIIWAFKKYITNLKFGFVIGWAVGLWFWVYENLLYYNNWVSVDIIFYRLFVVNGLIHILLSMLYGYIILNLDKIVASRRDVFKNYKLKYKNFVDLFRLVKFIYLNSKRSIKTIFWFFYKLLILDVVLNYIFKATNKPTTRWHSPVEVIIELFIFWFFIHLFYNLILIFIGWNVNLVSIIIFVFVYLWISRLVYYILESKVLTILISLILIFPFLMVLIWYSYFVKLWVIDLLFVYMLLVYLLVLLRQK